MVSKPFYSSKLKDNLLPRSKETSNAADALKEWFFTGIIIDGKQKTGVCQFCDREHLKYYCEIQNIVTQHKLCIGSTCILDFAIKMYDSKGKILSKTKAKQFLNDTLHDYQFTLCWNLLLELANGDSILVSTLNYYKTQQCFTPKQAAMVFEILTTNKINYNVKWFKISLKKEIHLEQMRELGIKIKFILPALTDAQLEQVKQSVSLEQMSCILKYISEKPTKVI